MDRSTRLQVLRSYETYCYQVCHYLLDDEQLATESAKEALLDLFADSRFFTSPTGVRKRMVLKIAASRSLQTYRRAEVNLHKLSGRC